MTVPQQNPMENAHEMNKEKILLQCDGMLPIAVTLRGSCSAHPTSCLHTKQQPSPVDAVHIEPHRCSPFPDLQSYSKTGRLTTFKPQCHVTAGLSVSRYCRSFSVMLLQVFQCHVTAGLSVSRYCRSFSVMLLQIFQCHVTADLSVSCYCRSFSVMLLQVFQYHVTAGLSVSCYCRSFSVMLLQVFQSQTVSCIATHLCSSAQFLINIKY
jgi:hypothetical protein